MNLAHYINNKPIVLCLSSFWNDELNVPRQIPDWLLDHVDAHAIFLIDTSSYPFIWDQGSTNYTANSFSGWRVLVNEYDPMVMGRYRWIDSKMDIESIKTTLKNYDFDFIVENAKSCLQVFQGQALLEHLTEAPCTSIKCFDGESQFDLEETVFAFGKKEKMTLEAFIKGKRIIELLMATYQMHYGWPIKYDDVVNGLMGRNDLMVSDDYDDAIAEALSFHWVDRKLITLWMMLAGAQRGITDPKEWAEKRIAFLAND